MTPNHLLTMENTRRLVGTWKAPQASPKLPNSQGSTLHRPAIPAASPKAEAKRGMQRARTAEEPCEILEQAPKGMPKHLPSLHGACDGPWAQTQGHKRRKSSAAASQRGTPPPGPSSWEARRQHLRRPVHLRCRQCPAQGHECVT